MAAQKVWSAVWTWSRQPNKSLVLTTHSIEEADSLCDRIGVLINGKLVALGTSLELKTTYGEGYKFDARVRHPTNIKDLHKVR
jgi:ABC-type multidrug transport system ATPase subunit